MTSRSDRLGDLALLVALGSQVLKNHIAKIKAVPKDSLSDDTREYYKARIETLSVLADESEDTNAYIEQVLREEVARRASCSN